jgi:CHAD domain-containing protein
VLSTVRERELKLAAPGSLVMPKLTDDHLGVIAMDELPELTLRSTYHDTADLRLARSGVTLRYRTGDETGPAWTLKLRVPGHDATERDEYLFPGGPAEVPGDALDLVTALVRTAPIQPVATLVTRRRRWNLCGAEGRPLAELFDDEVSVLDGGRVVSRFRELELESRGPDLAALRPIAVRLRRAGAVLAEPLPKAMRALGPRASAHPDVVVPALGAHASAREAVSAALASGYRRLVAHDAATRLGDAEGLHQMRVATRRLRSDLRTFRPLLDTAWVTGLRDELAWLARLLGDVRDLDVQLARLRETAGDLLEDLAPLVSSLAARRDVDRLALLEALRSDRYRTLLDRLVDAVHDPLVARRADKPAARLLPPLLARAWAAVEPAGSALGRDDPVERYHAVRIGVKRLRYAAEATGPALGPAARRCERLAIAAAELQDALGAMHDDAVAIDEVRAVLASHPETPFARAAGRLEERASAAINAARATYPDLWKRLARRYARIERRDR